MKSKATIVDVAKAAGVSKSTVSRVLNNQIHHMADETHEKVLVAINNLGYHPSSLARSLVSKKTQSVGLLISDVANPFYPEVIQGIEDVAIRSNYQVFLSNTNYDNDRSLKFVRSLVDKQVDGVMVMTSSVTDDLIFELTNNSMPVVVLDWELKQVEGIVGSITVDFETGIREAVQHLCKFGHQNIAHISGPMNLRTSQVRRDYFLEEAWKMGISTEQILIVEGDYQFQSGYDSLAFITQFKPQITAVFAANDLMALGFMSASREKGYRIPNDYSVIGLDDIQLSSWFYPKLTTIGLNRKMIGKSAMEMLLRLINESEPDTKPILHHQEKTFLVVRNSTCEVTRSTS